jgi:hypothetical protein
MELYMNRLTTLAGVAGGYDDLDLLYIDAAQIGVV